MNRLPITMISTNFLWAKQLIGKQQLPRLLQAKIGKEAKAKHAKSVINQLVMISLIYFLLSIVKLKVTTIGLNLLILRLFKNSGTEHFIVTTNTCAEKLVAVKTSVPLSHDIGAIDS